MSGPILMILGGAAIGGVVGGWAGAVGGALIGIGMIGAVAASMAAWAYSIGRQLSPNEAHAAAPRPWGFSALADRVYRLLD